MELPLTPSARPRRAPRRFSGAPVAEAPEALTGRLLPGRRRLRDEPYITGRRRLRDEPPYGTEALGRASLRAGGRGAYGTSLLTGRSAEYGRRLRDEPPYGPEALTGRASLRTEALSGPLRDEPPCAEALTDELPYTNGTSPSWAGGASGTSPYGGAYGTSVLTGRRRLRDEPLYRPELRASKRDGPLPRDPGGLRRRYGTSLLAGPHRFYGTTHYTGRNCFLTDRRRLQNEPPYTGRRRLRDEPRAGGAYGTSLLTGRRCWDEPRYGTDAEALAGLASLHNGGADGTSLLTGRRGPFTEGPDGPELPTSLRPRLRPEAYGTSGSEALRGGSLRGGLTGRASGRAGGGGLRDAALGRAFLRAGALIAGGACGTSLLTGRRRLRGTGLARRHSQTSLRTEAHFYGPEALTGRLLTGAEALTGRAPLRRRRLTGRDGGAGRLLTGQRRRRLRDEPPYVRGGGAYGTSLLTDGGAYGTSLLIYGTTLLALRHSRTSLLTLTGQRRLRDEPPYGGAYGTSVLTGGRRLRDEPLYRPELRASPRDFVPAPRKPALSSFPVKGPVSP